MNTGKQLRITNYKLRSLKGTRGFSLIELLIAMAITLVVLAAAFGVFKSMTDSGAVASRVYELTADKQAALNLIRLDLEKAASIPSSGVSLPAEIGINTTGVDYCTPVAGNNRAFTCGAGKTMLPVVGRDNGGNEVLDAVTPITVNGSPAIIILYEDNPNLKSATINGSNLTLDESDDTIRAGDFILLRSGASSVLRRVSSRDCATSGCQNIIALFSDGAGALSGSVNVTLLRRVAYYKEDAGNLTWLVRQVNSKAAERLVPGVEDFSMSYDLVPEAGTVSSMTSIESSLEPVSREKVTDFFNSTPERLRDIRRVNVDISLDSEQLPATVASGGTVKGAQRAGIAVRRKSIGSCAFCWQRWDEDTGTCLPEDPPCDVTANQYWNDEFESCGVCPGFMTPANCGCARRCTNLNQYWDALAGTCKDWQPLPGCKYTNSCTAMDCTIAGCSGNGDGGKYSCTVSFFDDKGNPITTFTAGKRLPPGITSATAFSGNAFSSGTLQIGNQNNSTIFASKHQIKVDGVTVAFMSYTNGDGDKSPIMPVKLSGTCSKGSSPLQCSAYYDDQCIADCRQYFESNPEQCNKITTCRIGGVCSK